MPSIVISARHQAGPSIKAMKDSAGARGVSRAASLGLGAMVGLLIGGLAVAQPTRADDVAMVGAMAGDVSVAEIFGASAARRIESLDDGSLASIRGRYVDARVPSDEGAGFVILWDERPGQGAGHDGKGSGRSTSIGLGNRQSTTVLTE